MINLPKMKLKNHRFNVSEYYRLGQIGLLPEDASVELMDGQGIDCVRISPLHASVTHCLAQPFFDLPQAACIVSLRNPVRLDEYSEVQPDVMLFKYREDYYKTRHPGPEDVFVLMEVADESLEYDRKAKLPAYGRAGIREVWIVNLIEAAIEVYRDPDFTGYSSKTILRIGDQAAPQAFSDVVVNVAELLKR